MNTKDIIYRGYYICLGNTGWWIKDEDGHVVNEVPFASDDHAMRHIDAVKRQQAALKR